LRSGYIQEDVENYLYDLLPKRDAVIDEIEDYAANNRVPIIGPAVKQLLHCWCKFPERSASSKWDPPSGIRRYGWRGPAGAKAEVFYSDGNPENAKRA